MGRSYVPPDAEKHLHTAQKSKVRLRPTLRASAPGKPARVLDHEEPGPRAGRDHWLEWALVGRGNRAGAMDDVNPYQAPSRQSGESGEDAPFFVECVCGRYVGVTAGMAGTEAACECGHVLPVPGLSELRRKAGHEPYGDDAVVLIRRALAERDSLPGDNCVGCGSSTQQSLVCVAECERPARERRGCARHLIAFVSLPFYLFAEMTERWRKEELHGRETVLHIPITVCRNCRARIAGVQHGQALRAVVERVPEFRRLLEQYPNTELTIAE
jgi:hypothetical protein